MTTPPPVYNPDVPQPNDPFNDSQLPFQKNFSTLYDAFLKNHVALDAVANAGNHTILEMPAQTLPFQNSGGEISLYGRDIPDQTTQAFMRFQGNQDEFRYTNYQIYSLGTIVAPPLIQISFITFLPGNFLVFFGQILSSKATQSTVQLIPRVVKNIVTCNFTSINVAARPPTVTLTPYQNNIINSINLVSPDLPVGLPDYYYFVLANI